MKELFDYTHCFAGEYLSEFPFVWQAMEEFPDYLMKKGRELPPSQFLEHKPGVWISKSSKIAETAHIDPPCIICDNSEVRHSAFIRGGVLIGRGCVVGNSCEIKNSVLFDMCQIPHFNYIGDSVIGYRAHFGAGSITSNLKCDGSEVVIRVGDLSFYTGLRKFGAAVGDEAQIGCHVTLNPGTLIGKNSIIYPNTSIRGYVPESMICKSSELWIERRSERDG